MVSPAYNVTTPPQVDLLRKACPVPAKGDVLRVECEPNDKANSVQTLRSEQRTARPLTKDTYTPSQQTADVSYIEEEQGRKEQLQAERRERQERLEEEKREREERLKAERREKEERLEAEKKAEQEAQHTKVLDKIRERLFSDLYDLAESHRASEDRTALRNALVARIDRFA